MYDWTPNEIGISSLVWVGINGGLFAVVDVYGGVDDCDDDDGDGLFVLSFDVHMTNLLNLIAVYCFRMFDKIWSRIWLRIWWFW